MPETKQQAWGKFPLKGPIKAEKMLELQRNTAKAELILKDKHNASSVLDKTY